MHELSIAMAILDTVRQKASAHGACAVTLVRLRIGDLSGVETDSLSFCFDAVKNEHQMTSSTRLLIENVPVSVRCEKCDDEFKAAGHFVTCPSCGGYDTRLLTGEELQIVDFEIE